MNKTSENIIAKMTISEKCSLLTGLNFWSTRGIERLGIPPLVFSDGTLGLRVQAKGGDHLGLGKSLPATCFPAPSCMANSWDSTLIEELGGCLGLEAKAQGTDVLLAPGMNIKRNPLCGRNFEYISEDPFLTGKLAAAYIRGIQNRGVAACPKHFAVNSRETERMSYNSVIDERTLREIYLYAFEIAIKEAKPLALMSAYNKINGVYAHENKHLLSDILRDEWGFGGIVVSDWGGCNDFTASLRAGANVEMPGTGGNSAAELKEALEGGAISEDELDERLGEYLDVVFKLHDTKDAAPGSFAAPDMSEIFREHEIAAGKFAEGSIVLLKNEGNILPLKKGAKVAIVGEYARSPKYQGLGSSYVNSTKVDTVLSLISEYELEFTGFSSGYEAAEPAKNSDCVLFFMGTDGFADIEGSDRESMALPEAQEDLLEKLSRVNKNIIVVLSGGCAVTFRHLDKCRALLQAGLCGQAGAGAIWNIITGKVNPSGKLAESYPYSYKDCPSSNYFLLKGNNAEYREGLYVGYRYYEGNARFPFGFGLSYTTFEYSDIMAAPDKVSFNLKNTGKTGGAEISQIYVHAISPAVYRPTKVLAGFSKTYLEPGEAKTVTIHIDKRAYQYFDAAKKEFVTDAGFYEILAGASVRDIKLTARVEVTKEVAGDGERFETEKPFAEEEATAREKAPTPQAYLDADIKNVSDEDFEALLGHKIPNQEIKEPLTMNDSFSRLRYAKSLKGRLLAKFLSFLVKRSKRKNKPSVNLFFVQSMTFRGIEKLTGGRFSKEMAEGVLRIVNGHAISFFKGLGKIIAGYFKKKTKN